MWDSDEQLQHIEKRMLMEINWGLGADTNPESNIKVVTSYRKQNNEVPNEISIDSYSFNGYG